MTSSALNGSSNASQPGDETLDTEVLIVGAVPTGLVLALWLIRLGVRVRITDKTAEPGTTSRALALQARTLELYDQIGLTKEIVERGPRFAAANLWVAGQQVARAVFGDMGVGISPYPYALIFPQDEHEQLLIDHLTKAGVQVERRTELLHFEEVNGRVLACLKRSGGELETCEVAYLAGCDGAHSTVREALNIGFPGGTHTHLFYVADVQARGKASHGESHVAFGPNIQDVSSDSCRCTFLVGARVWAGAVCNVMPSISCGPTATWLWRIARVMPRRSRPIWTRTRLPWLANGGAAATSGLLYVRYLRSGARFA